MRITFIYFFHNRYQGAGPIRLWSESQLSYYYNPLLDHVKLLDPWHSTAMRSSGASGINFPKTDLWTWQPVIAFHLATISSHRRCSSPGKVLVWLQIAGSSIILLPSQIPLFRFRAKTSHSAGIVKIRFVACFIRSPGIPICYANFLIKIN